MTTFLFAFLFISQTISITTELSCITSDDSTTSCPSFCAETIEETIFIAIKDPICPVYTDLDSTDDANFSDINFSTTIEQQLNNECIKTETGCGIPWLCDLINNASSSCSTADLLFNIYQLDCDLNSLIMQYTNFKLQMTCCNQSNCNTFNPKCSYNAIYQMYSNYLYKCLFSMNARDNKYENVRKCNDSFNDNNYADVCDFLISQTYSTDGCQCKSSFLIAHYFKNDNSDLETHVSEWMYNQLIEETHMLTLYGCASNLQCVPNDRQDDVFVGGLLNIERILYIVECNVFVPYHNINSSAIQHIEHMLEPNDPQKIYVTFLDNNDPSFSGVGLHIFVVYFKVEERNVKYNAWINDTDWFGEGSEITDVDKKDINETLSYYGAEKYYKRESRDKRQSQIAATIVALCVSLLLIGIGMYHYKKMMNEEKEKCDKDEINY